MAWGIQGLPAHYSRDSVQPIAQDCWMIKDLRYQPPKPRVLKRIRNTDLLPALPKLAQMQHPQLPRLWDYWQTEGILYWVQDPVTGFSLLETLENPITLPESQIRRILSEVLPVLAYLHGHRFIHGGIRPNSLIYRDPDGVVVPTAWNLQATIGSSWLMFGGDPEYGAPEQLRSEGVPASDLYSLGLTCAKALTGDPAFDLIDRVEERLQLANQVGLNPYSDGLARLLIRMTHPQLADRFSSAAEVLQAMGNPRPLFAPQPDGISWHCMQTLTGSVPLKAIALSPQTLATAGDTDQIQLWYLPEITPFASLQDLSLAHPPTLAFAPNGQLLTSTRQDGSLLLWDLQTQRIQKTLTGHAQLVTALQFSPDGKELMSGSRDGRIRCWQVGTGECQSEWVAHRLGINSLIYSPDGSLLASASQDRVVKLWQRHADQWELRHQITGHTWEVLALAFSPGSSPLLASAGNDNTIQIWDPMTGQRIRTLSGHSWRVTGLAFDATGDLLLSSSWDHTLKLWQVSSGKQLAILSGHTSWVTGVVLDPVSGEAISIGHDQTIRRWGWF